MAFKTQDDIVRWYKNFDSANSYQKSNEEIYKLASQYTSQKFGKALKPYIPKVAPTSVEGMPLRPMGDKTDPLASAKTSPDDIKGLTGIAASIGTTGLSGWMAEYLPEGLDLPGESFDISPEFFQQSYNNSMAGQLYQSIYGEPAYKVEDYDPSWVSEAGQFMLGMVNVPEVAAFATGSRLGLWGATKATTALHKYGMLGVNASAKTKALSSRAMSTAFVQSGLETGIALGTLGGAHSAAASAAQQRVDPEGDGTISVSKTMMDGAKGFAESFLIGAPAGAVAKGFLGSKYAMAKLASDDKTLDMATRALYGLPSQIGTEALAFTTFPNLYKSVGLGFKDYPTIGSEEWNQGLFQNTVVIGTMAGFGKLAREAKGVDESYIWAQKLLQQSVRDIKQLRNSAENVKTSLESSGVKINPEMLKLISDSNQGAFLEPKAYEKFIKDQEIVSKLIAKDSSKWTQSERTQLQDILLPTKLVELGLWRELQQNEGTFRKILEEVQGREITDTEFNTYAKALDNQINQTVNTFNDMNEALVGFNANSGTKPAADPSFKPVKMTKDTGVLDYQGRPIIKTEIAQSAAQSADLLRRGYAEEGAVPSAPGQGKVESTKTISKGSSSISEFEAALERRGVGYDRITETKKAEE